MRLVKPAAEVTFPSRATELAVALDWLGRRAGRPGGGLLLVAGEGGSGRSRLLRELAEAVLRERPRTRVIAHDRREQSASLRSWPNEVARYARGGAAAADIGKTVAGHGALLAPGVAPAAGAAHGALGAAARVLRASAGVIDKAMSRAVPDTTDPGDLLGYARGQARGMAGRQVLLVIDDLDLTDSALWSVQVQRFVIERMGSTSVTVVAGLEAAPDQQLLSWALERRRDSVHALVLGDLDRADLEELVGSASPEVVDALLEHSAGNARRAANAWRGWRRSGVVARSTPLSGWRLAEQRPAPTDHVDRLLTVTAEVDGQATASGPLRRLLAAGAQQGEVFVVAAAADAAEVPADEADEVVMNAAARGLLAESGVFWAPGMPARVRLMRFADPQVWDHLDRTGVEGSPAAAARAQVDALHRLFAEDLDAVSTALVRLFRLAGDTASATRWAQQRRRAVRHSDGATYLEAVSALPPELLDGASASAVAGSLVLLYDQDPATSRALAIAERAWAFACAGPERSVIERAGRIRAAAHLLASSETGRADSVRCAEEVVERLSDRPGSVELLRARVTHWEATYGNDGPATPDLVALRQLLDDGRRLGDARTVCRAAAALGVHSDPVEALALSRECFDTALDAGLPAARHGMGLQLVYWAAGRMDDEELRAVAERTLEVAPFEPYDGAAVVSHASLARCALAVGDPRGARDHLLAAVRAADVADDLARLGQSLLDLGWYLLRTCGIADGGVGCLLLGRFVSRELAPPGSAPDLEAVDAELAEWVDPAQAGEAADAVRAWWDRDRGASVVAAAAAQVQ